MRDESQKVYFDRAGGTSILEPTVTEDTKKLRQFCVDVSQKCKNVLEITDRFIENSEKLWKQIENEKMKVIGLELKLRLCDLGSEKEQREILSSMNTKKEELKLKKEEFKDILKAEKELNEKLDQAFLQ